MTAPHNPPAFPVKVKRNTSTDPLATPREVQIEGMSLRDWFAGQIGCGYLSGVIIDAEVGSTLQEPEVLARKFYQIADAMLTVRAGGSQ